MLRPSRLCVISMAAVLIWMISPAVSSATTPTGKKSSALTRHSSATEVRVSRSSLPILTRFVDGAIAEPTLWVTIDQSRSRRDRPALRDHGALRFERSAPMGLIKEFKEFALKGNVIDLAVAVIIAAAFGKVISSIVDDIVMPPVGVLVGKHDFADYFITLTGGHYETLAQA